MNYAGQAPPLPRLGLYGALRLIFTYLRRHRRLPNLIRPRRFTEKIQWRKLFDRDPIYAVITDRIAARGFIESRVGTDVLPPLLWTGTVVEEIPFDSLDPPYIVKCTHANGNHIFVTAPSELDQAAARTVLKAQLSKNYGRKRREPAYVPIEPRLLVERLMLEADGTHPIEYKIFTFDGTARLVKCTRVDHRRKNLDSLYDLNWKLLGWRISYELSPTPVPRPENLDEMISLAERLSAGFDHLRVDFFKWMGRPIVGELTVYSGSGFNRSDPDAADLILGSYWQIRQPVRRALYAVLGKYSWPSSRR